MSGASLLPDVDVRRLAAVDMYGAQGTRLRRRVILLEFAFGTIGGALFGAWILTHWGSDVGLPIGIWLLGISVNYFALAVHAARLSRSGALDSELRDVDLAAAVRYYNVAQFWIFVPTLFGIMAVIQLTSAGRGR